MTFGVDTVGLSFAVSGGDTEGATATVSNYGTDEARAEYRRKLPGGGFVSWGRGRVAWVEASLPKRVSSSNVEALPLSAALDAAEDLYLEACQFVSPDVGTVYRAREGVRVDGRTFDGCQLKRLDVVRDFDGVAIGPLLDGLATAVRGRSVKVRRFADAEAGNSETLRVGVRSSWSTVLYDKHAETDGLAPVGRLRYETRLRDGFLCGSVVKDLVGHAVPDVPSLRSLGQTGICELGRERFRFVGFDRQVSGTEVFAEAVRSAPLTPRQKRDLLAFLAADQLGIDLGMHRNTVRKYRKLAEDLGFTLGLRVAPEASLRLDLDSGVQVLEVGHSDGDL